jgi:hypothetical protein
MHAADTAGCKQRMPTCAVISMVAATVVAPVAFNAKTGPKSRRLTLKIPFSLEKRSISSLLSPTMIFPSTSRRWPEPHPLCGWLPHFTGRFQVVGKWQTVRITVDSNAPTARPLFKAVSTSSRISNRTPLAWPPRSHSAQPGIHHSEKSLAPQKRLFFGFDLIHQYNEIWKLFRPLAAPSLSVSNPSTNLGAEAGSGRTYSTWTRHWWPCFGKSCWRVAPGSG